MNPPFGPNGRSIRPSAPSPLRATRRSFVMAMSTRIDAALASGWFGAGLSDVTRTRLAELAELITIGAGSVVLNEGSAVDSFAVVVDGRLSIRLSVPGRGAVTVLTIEPGDCV